MNFIDKIKKIFKKSKLNQLPKAGVKDTYSSKVESIDNIGLIQSFVDGLSDDLKMEIRKYQGKVPYYEPLQTKISYEQLIDIVKGFFKDIDNEIFLKINNILEGKESRFNLSIDAKWNGKNCVSSPDAQQIDIKVGKYGDLRDVYGIIHELTHCLDIKDKDTSTRRILGEVAPQCMERLLDNYLIENCNSLGLNNEVLLKDIEIRKFTTFISRAQNAMDFTSKVGNREVDSRYVLAQLYQSELMKNYPNQAKSKLVNFINYVKNDEFEKANEALGIRLERNNHIYRDIIVNSAILEGENLLEKTTQKPSKINVVDINDIDLNNSYFHFTKKDNLEQIMNFIDKIKKFFKKSKLNQLPKAGVKDTYSSKVESIDNIGLIQSFVDGLSDDLKMEIRKYQGKVPYYEPLQTKISYEQLIDIVKGFFKDIDNEIFLKINNILEGKESRFNLSIDAKWNGKNCVSSPDAQQIDIKVGKYGDLRDVYGIIHELTHCLDIKDKDTSTRRILGEVAPQCMERLLDNYLIENCNSLGLNNEVLLKDIEIRKFTTFISRAQNAMDFTSKVGNREVDSRYVLAQLYQSELMKNYPNQAKSKLVNFINYVKNDEFEKANEALGIRLERNNHIYRDIIVNSAILEGENLLEKTTQKPSKINVVDINDIDLNNSYFHFTNKDNLEQIISEGLKPKIGDASKMKKEDKPRVYMSKGGKGLIEIKNSFIYEFKNLRVCDIPLEYRRYFNIEDYSSQKQIDEKTLYDAMEKRFKDEIYFKVDAIEDEDFLIEDNYTDDLKEDFSIENLRNMFIEHPQRDIKGKANHTIEAEKLSLIKTDKGNTALDVVECLYNKLLQNAKKIGKEDIVRSTNSDLDNFFEYIRQKEKKAEER